MSCPENGDTYPYPVVTENAALQVDWRSNAISQRGLFFSRNRTYGGVRDMEALELVPGEVGFIKFITIMVHPWPSNPQPPVLCISDCIHNIMQFYLFEDTWSSKT